MIDKNNERTKTKIKKRKDVGDSIVLFEDENWLIVIPLDHNASCFHGKNTDWCTTKPNESHFSSYFYDKKITLIYLLHKQTGNKWAIAYHDGVDKYELFDVSDNDMSDSEFKLQTGFNPEKIITWAKTKKPDIEHGRNENKHKDLDYMVKTACNSGKRDERVEKELENTKNVKLSNMYLKFFPDATINIPYKNVLREVIARNIEYEYLCPEFRNLGDYTYTHTKDNGDKFWYKYGVLHREDGPAVEYADGGKVWYIHGDKHREDGPAVELPDGTKAWCVHGKLHREDGPAVERANGSKEWHIHGERHREDGPAVTFEDGAAQWFLSGNRIHSWEQYHKLSSLPPDKQAEVEAKYKGQLAV